MLKLGRALPAAEVSVKCGAPEQAGEEGGDCNCEFSPEMADGDEPSYLYRRVCNQCGEVWGGLHCPHDGVQNPCPGCGAVPDGKPTPLQKLFGFGGVGRSRVV